jgi:hypothetical protein
MDDSRSSRGCNGNSSGSVATRSATEELARRREHRWLVTKRAILAGVSAFVAVNIWTGAPLLALWVGARLVGQAALSMQGVLIVVAVLAILVFTLTVLLTWINQVYLDLVKARRAARQPQWLSHLGDEPEREVKRWASFSTIEQIVVASVYVAAIALLAWFFFIAGSPLPQ